MRSFLTIILLVLTASAATVSAIAAGTSEFIPLGDLSGGDYYSIAYGVSGNGVVAGMSKSANGDEAFRWTQAGGMVGLGALSGTFSSVAVDVSAGGDIIVGRSGECSARSQGFFWSSATGMVPVDCLSEINAISDYGNRIVGADKDSHPLQRATAHYWSNPCGQNVNCGIGIGVLPNHTDSRARAVSPAGSVIVGYGLNYISSAVRGAFRWSGGTMVPWDDSELSGISSDGDVIVGSLGGLPARWDGSQLTYLDLVTGFVSGHASAVSNDGNVIVGNVANNNCTTCPRAFIWNANDGSQELQQVLEADTTLDLTGWTLLSATDLSPDGHVVVGHGINPNGDFEAWMAVLNYESPIVDPSPGCPPHVVISHAQGGLTSSLEINTHFADGVAPIGDLDGDGKQDLAVCAPLDDEGGFDTGAVWILFLNPDGTVKSEQKIAASATALGGAVGLNEHFGRSVASLGDLDGPGGSALALAVGQIGESSVSGVGRVGAVWILFLNTDGTVSGAQQIGSGIGGMPDYLGELDEFGISVTSLGDLDGAGGSQHAIAVGAHQDNTAAPEAGAVWILFLNSNGIVSDAKRITTGSNGFADSLTTDNSLGVSVAYLGDLGPGAPTPHALAVGAPGDDDGGTDQGAAWVLFLTDSGTVDTHRKISATHGGFGGRLDPGDWFGVGASRLDDFNGDGITDLMVGTPRDDDGGPDRGAVWLLFLNVDGTVKGYKKLSATRGEFPCEIRDEDRFGFSVASLDVDQAGSPELVVGAWNYRKGTGAAWIVFADSTTVTGVAERTPNTISVLEQSYPNPFNPTTTIRFTLTRRQRTTLRVYDVSGRLVRTLVNATLKPGPHTVQWDGTNDQGSRVGSGVYFYRLTGEGTTQTRKAVLLK